MISPQGAATAFGTVPRVRAYKVVAVFDAGLNDYNNSVVFMPLPAAQVFFQKPDAITGIEIRVAQPDNVDALLPPLRQVLDGRKVWLRDWRHANDTIIGVLQVQKDTMFIVLGMIVLVAAFNVISSLIMMVKDKTRDIAVLRTIGADSCRGAAHLPDVRRIRRRHRHADRHRHRRRVLPQHRGGPACGGERHRRTRCSIRRCSC